MERTDFEKRVQRGFWGIVFAYALFGVAWILTTDYLVARSFHYGDARLIEVSKGLFYVFVTALLLLVLLMRLKRILVQAFASRYEARQRLFAIVDSPLIGIAVWHADGRLLELNETFLNLWGYTREQFAAEQPTFEKLSPPANRERDLACLRAAVADGIPGPYVKELLRRDGSIMPVLTGVTASSPIAAEGILFLLDDTERRRAIEEREKTLSELETIVEHRTRDLALANKDLESFAYSISHDLRAPLRSIDGMASIADEEIPQEFAQAKHALSRVHEHVRRMAGLIDSLLRLSQVTRRPLRQEPVDLTQLIQKIEVELKDSYPSSKVKVDVQEGLRAFGDPELLQVALYNILDNAWKFTAGRPDATVLVTGDARSLTIRDNGQGFASDLSEKIFLPFSRLQSAEPVAGAGIGLAIVERIVRGHGWRIEAVGHPGDGAEFTITFAQDGGPTGTAPPPEPV